LSYRPADVLDLVQRYRALTLMREGHDRRVWDVISGPTCWGALSCFAYRYEVGFGVHRAVRTWAVAVIESNGRWGQVALRCNCPDAPEPTPWDGPASTMPLPGRGRCSVTAAARADSTNLTLPDGLVDWLDSLGRDLCVELRGHLVAVQVPMASGGLPVAWLVRTVQQLAERLGAAAVVAEEPTRQQAVSPVGSPQVRPEVPGPGGTDARS
jgi:hypothetical protein